MNQSVNAWIIGMKYYLPCMLIGLLLTYIGLIYYKSLLPIGIVIFILSIFILFFFRDFPRKITTKEDEITSPADGTIVEIKEIEKKEYYDGKCLRVSIFMSVFNAHVNRSPYDGVIKKIVYKKGKFMNAMKSQSSEYNESNTLFIETKRGDITVRQIAGKIARRIVCPIKEGTFLKKGEKFGMIKFGSRVELYLPLNCE
ncbi:MAG: phosphatidylserine decarboxylase, partial [Candidatus Hydrogenedens sp.]